jgi:signal transduction histidine kinase/DNA-binding response OmpR family regulator
MARRAKPLILVVDDTAANRFVVAGILSRAGYTIVEAGSGAEAMQKVEQRPDLVVLDVRLPDTTGFEISRRWRELPERQSMPILFISASFTGPGAHAQGLDSGADGYLTHPVDPGVLQATVRSLLRVRRSEEIERVLADASQLFAQSLDPDDVARALVKIAVTRTAEACVVCQFADEGVRVVALGQTRDDRRRDLEAVFEAHPPRVEAGDMIAVPFQQREPVPYEPTGGRGAALAAMGLCTALTIPLVARGKVFGSVTFFREEAGIDDIAVRMYADLASRAALAADNARLFSLADAARKEAQIANNAKMDFLAAMSHELRTPLNAIAGYVDLLMMGLRGPLTQEQTADLARVALNQRHLASLIEDILNYARVDAGRIEYDIEPVNVNEAVSEVVGLLHGAYGSKGVRLDYAAIEPSAHALADPDRLRQVLINLLGNAVKFTPAGGTVTVRAGAAGEQVEIICRDTGVGIPREKLDAIFEPFVQVTRNTAEQRSGLGLGLTISRDLMRGMQGDLVVESELDRGSAFTLTLPRAEAMQPSA